MSLAKLFKSHAPVMGHVFRSGKTIHFMNHIYTTTVQSEIDELTEEANSGHPNIYIDPEMTEIDPKMLDPMAVLVARIREEERAKLIAASNPLNDMGKTDQGGKLQGISNSDSVRGLQVSSDSQAAALTSMTQTAETGAKTAGVQVGAIKLAK